MVEYKDAETTSVEINGGNLKSLVQFSAEVDGLNPKTPDRLIISGEITPPDVVSAITNCADKGISVNPTVVKELLKHVPVTYEELGAIAAACAKGITNVTKKDVTKKEVNELGTRGKLRELSGWRSVRNVATVEQDIKANKAVLDQRAPINAQNSQV